MTKIIDMLTDGDQLLKCLSLIYMSSGTFISVRWVIFCAFTVVCRLFSKSTFKKKSFRNTIRGSNG